jgi:ankyrin repeat protein
MRNLETNNHTNEIHSLKEIDELAKEKEELVKETDELAKEMKELAKEKEELVRKIAELDPNYRERLAKKIVELYPNHREGLAKKIAELKPTQIDELTKEIDKLEFNKEDQLRKKVEKLEKRTLKLEIKEIAKQKLEIQNRLKSLEPKVEGENFIRIHDEVILRNLEINIRDLRTLNMTHEPHILEKIGKLKSELKSLKANARTEDEAIMLLTEVTPKNVTDQARKLTSLLSDIEIKGAELKSLKKIQNQIAKTKILKDNAGTVEKAIMLLKEMEHISLVKSGFKLQWPLEEIETKGNELKSLQEEMQSDEPKSLQDIATIESCVKSCKGIFTGMLLSTLQNRNTGEDLIERIKALVEAGAIIDFAPTNFNEGNPLYLAARHGHTAVAKYLITQGANKDAVDHYQETALHAAAKNGHTEVVEYLLNAGFNKDARNMRKETPLHLAVKEGHLATVKVLISKGANVQVKAYIGITPLHLAVKAGNKEMVEDLIKAGADIYARNEILQTPLHWAADGDSKEMLECLLKAGAKMGAKDSQGRLTVDYVLYWAARYGNTEGVKYLITQGANKDAVNQHQETPLHAAAEDGRTEVVEYLIEAGANKEAVNQHQETPLHWAVQEGHLATVKVLISKGANVQAKTHHNVTPLHLAANGNSKEMLECLLKAGAKVDAKDSEGRVPLDYATYNNKITPQLFNEMLEEYSDGVEFSAAAAAAPAESIDGAW